MVKNIYIGIIVLISVALISQSATIKFEHTPTGYARFFMLFQSSLFLGHHYFHIYNGHRTVGGCLGPKSCSR